MKEVDLLLNSTITGLRQSEPLFANSLKKWQPFLSRTVNDLHRTIKRDPIDIAQDLLLSAVEANISYKMELYRYNKKLYVVDLEDGSIVRVCSPRYKKKVKTGPFWVNKDSVIKVKKARYDTFLYSVLSQQYMDMLTLHFTRKNGYNIISKKGRIKEVEKVFSEISECQFGTEEKGLFDNLCIDDTSSPEGLAIVREALAKIISRISSDAIYVLQYMITYPGIGIHRIAELCEFSRSQVLNCISQIRSAASVAQFARPVYFQPVFPVRA